MHPPCTRWPVLCSWRHPTLTPVSSRCPESFYRQQQESAPGRLVFHVRAQRPWGFPFPPAFRISGIPSPMPRRVVSCLVLPFPFPHGSGTQPLFPAPWASADTSSFVGYSVILICLRFVAGPTLINLRKAATVSPAIISELCPPPPRNQHDSPFGFETGGAPT